MTNPKSAFQKIHEQASKNASRESNAVYVCEVNILQLAKEGTKHESNGLYLADVSQQRELFYNFITWYNAKPRIEKPKDGLITTTIIEEYLKL